MHQFAASSVSALLSQRVHRSDLEEFFRNDECLVQQVREHRSHKIMEACVLNLGIDLPDGISSIIIQFEEINSINFLEQHRHQQAWKIFESSFPRSLLISFKLIRYVSNAAIIGSALYHSYKWLDRASTSKEINLELASLPSEPYASIGPVGAVGAVGPVASTAGVGMNFRKLRHVDQSLASQTRVSGNFGDVDGKYQKYNINVVWGGGSGGSGGSHGRAGAGQSGLGYFGADFRTIHESTLASLPTFLQIFPVPGCLHNNNNLHMDARNAQFWHRLFPNLSYAVPIISVWFVAELSKNIIFFNTNKMIQQFSYYLPSFDNDWNIKHNSHLSRKEFNDKVKALALYHE